MTACEPSVNQLTQLKSVPGCIAGDGYGGLCRDGKYLNGAAAASTPDGKFVYVADPDDSVLGIFQRLSNGDLVQKGCVTQDAVGCAQTSRAMSHPVGVVATKNAVYVAGQNSNGLAVFVRDPATGALKQSKGRAGCVTESGTDGASGSCTVAHPMTSPSALAVLGNTIAVAASNGVAVITRDAKSGKLTQAPDPKGCITTDGSAATCAVGRALDNPAGVALTSAAIFVTSPGVNAVAVIARDPASGLVQDPAAKGCISEDGQDGNAGVCADAHALQSPQAILANGNRFYVAAEDSDALSQFTRSNTGNVAQFGDGAGCISNTGRSDPAQAGTQGDCADGRGMQNPVTLAMRGSTIFVGSPLPFSPGPGSDPAVAAIDVNPGSSEFTQPGGTEGCISEFADDGCADGYALDDVVALTIAKNGPLFAVSGGVQEYGPLGDQFDDGALSILDRDRITGAFSEGTEGNAGCISETGRSSATDPSTAGRCANGIGLLDPVGVATSPDGRNVYVVSQGSDAIAAFRRNTKTGALSQLPSDAACISESAAGACTKGRGLFDPQDIAISADGKNVYVASKTSKAVAVFARNAAGALKQLGGTNGCISDTATEGCADGTALDGASGVAVSSDGKNVYVASQTSDALAAFGRNTATGALTQLGGLSACVSESGSGCTDGKALDGALNVALNASGNSVYVASGLGDAVAIFSRDTGTGVVAQLTDPDGCWSISGNSGQCRVASGLDFPMSVATAGDANVYVRAGNSVFSFSRSGGGELVELSGVDGCISETGASPCRDGHGLTSTGTVAVASNTEAVYAASIGSNAVAVLDRNTSDGTLSQQGSVGGCNSTTDPECVEAKALAHADAVAVSPDDTTVYVVSEDDDAIAVFPRSLG